MEVVSCYGDLDEEVFEKSVEKRELTSDLDVVVGADYSMDKLSVAAPLTSTAIYGDNVLSDSIDSNCLTPVVCDLAPSMGPSNSSTSILPSSLDYNDLILSNIEDSTPSIETLTPSLKSMPENEDVSTLNVPKRNSKEGKDTSYSTRSNENGIVFRDSKQNKPKRVKPKVNSDIHKNLHSSDVNIPSTRMDSDDSSSVLDLSLSETGSMNESTSRDSECSRCENGDVHNIVGDDIADRKCDAQLSFRESKLNSDKSSIAIENDSGHISDYGFESNKNISVSSQNDTPAVISQCLSTVCENTHSSTNLLYSCVISKNVSTHVLETTTQHSETFQHYQANYCQSNPSDENSCSSNPTSYQNINPNFDTITIDKTFRRLDTFSQTTSSKTVSSKTTFNPPVSDCHNQTSYDEKTEKNNECFDHHYATHPDRTNSVDSSTDSNEIIDFVGSFGDDDDDKPFSIQADFKAENDQSTSNVPSVSDVNESIVSPGLNSSTSSMSSMFNFDRQSVTDGLDTANTVKGNFSYTYLVHFFHIRNMDGMV